MNLYIYMPCVIGRFDFEAMFDDIDPDIAIVYDPEERVAFHTKLNYIGYEVRRNTLALPIDATTYPGDIVFLGTGIEFEPLFVRLRQMGRRLSFVGPVGRDLLPFGREIKNVWSL